jgi:hypothetical protein
MKKSKATIQFFNDLKSINRGRVYTVNKIKKQVSVKDLIVGNDYLVDVDESKRLVKGKWRSFQNLELCNLIGIKDNHSSFVHLHFSKPNGEKFKKTIFSINFDNIEVYTQKFDINFIETRYIDVISLSEYYRFSLTINDNGKFCL